MGVPKDPPHVVSCPTRLSSISTSREPKFVCLRMSNDLSFFRQCNIWSDCWFTVSSLSNFQLRQWHLFLACCIAYHRWFCCAAEFHFQNIGTTCYLLLATCPSPVDGDNVKYGTFVLAMPEDHNLCYNFQCISLNYRLFFQMCLHN